MNYQFSNDLISIREILGITQDQLAEQISVQPVTLSRNELCETEPSYGLLERVYGYAFDKNINLGKLKEMFWHETVKPEHKLLFHGAKNKIEGSVDVRSGTEEPV